MRCVNTKSILIVRHGATIATKAGVYCGSSDSPLSSEGVNQALDLAGVVALFAPESCCCSPLLRCTETASLLLGSRDVEISPWSELRELDFGEWEGKTYSDIAASDPEGSARMMRLDPEFSPPGGEPVEKFLDRIGEAARRIGDCPFNRLLVVTQGGVARRLMAGWMGMGLQQGFHSFEFGPGAFAEITLFPEGPVLHRLLQGKEVDP
jgi:broad specificity phosphatase PhoE